jgi:TRAP-type C4-dicarboxylate transport system permease small subunit
MFAVIEKLASALANLALILSRLMLVFVAAILFIQVVLRFGFNYSLPWPEEAARYVMIWLVMLTGGVLIRDQQLICVDFFDKYWPPKVIHYRNALFRLCLVGLLGVLFYEGLEQALESSYRVTTTLEISWLWPYLAVPVGAALMLLHMACLAVRDLAGQARAWSQPQSVDAQLL